MNAPTQIQWEWIFAWALVEGKTLSAQTIKRVTKLPFPGLMRKCPKCGREFYFDCVSCTYRNGGEIGGAESRTPDLVDQFNGMVSDAGYRLENALEEIGWYRR